MEQKLAIITMSQATNQLFKEQLEDVLKNRIEVRGYSLDDSIVEQVDADLVLTTKSLGAEIENYIAEDSEVIFARRALDLSTLEKLIKLPTAKKALLINNTKLAVLETHSLLQEVGIDHLELIPFYPGCDKEEVKEVELAINLGEEKYIPDSITKVINIGSRILDLTTIVEILIKLDLLGERANLLISEQVRQLVELSKRLNRKIIDMERANKKLDAVLNHVHDGIIYINENEEIEVFNRRAEEIFEVKAEEMLGQKIGNKIANTNLNRVLKNGFKEINALQNVGDKKIVTTRVPLKREEDIIGALATFKDVTEVKKLEEDLRRKLKNKGHVAKYKFRDIIGESREVKQVIEKAKKLAKSKSTVLLQGESGTGKELFAGAIHNHSQRSNKPFVAINCAALPENLLESELFGYEEGAFTGAKKGGKPGVFEQAHTGSIFLDEIGDIPLNIQARLLRVLQEKEVMRIGATQVIPIDIRILAATNKDLEELVAAGEFREDLYYRLNILSLQLPPLRMRREDIPVLIDYFLDKFAREDLRLSKEAISRLYNYDWQGNIRQLENCVEYITQVCESEVKLADLPSYLRPTNGQEKQQDIREIEEKLDELGKIDQYIFILNELYLAKQLGEKIGRREIANNAEANELYLSSQMVRSRLKKLEEYGLVSIGRGRQGTEIISKGIKFLKAMTKKEVR
ncbi:sigma 54-interacting transcriptional regulator [Natroniella sulfidigena]|uniref:sigma-54 interaction domain-containing protein n=1 Tax=Natroniella sulfidigena TaxID=723921 RepID=UPI00200A52B4|nr:sigma 54-interacting transcriptional regulator [Natroniella sulfidigena]MCK8815834.1 sigma 54-interacting transcriptional regulator [Natroniella sulfidigena]